MQGTHATAACMFTAWSFCCDQQRVPHSHYLDYVQTLIPTLSMCVESILCTESLAWEWGYCVTVDACLSYTIDLTLCHQGIKGTFPFSTSQLLWPYKTWHSQFLILHVSACLNCWVGIAKSFLSSHAMCHRGLPKSSYGMFDVMMFRCYTSSK